MPRHKTFKATRTLKLDCGHTVKEGESFVMTNLFTCGKEGAWPLTILMACFQVMQEKRAQRPKKS